MRASCAAGILVLALTGLPTTQAGAQGMRVHMHGAGDYAADGVLFKPTGQPPFPAILFIPDERGLTQHVLDAAADFAAAGYVAVAVDLNRGVSADAATRSDEQALQDLESAFTFLSAQSDVRKESIGALGWGSGGRHALRLAAASKLRAVAIEETPLPKVAMDLGAVHAAVLGSFGGRDAGASVQSVKAFEKRLRALGDTVDIKIYPEAGHGFDDPGESAQFRPHDAEDVQHRTRDFFAAQLGRPR
jgi:carboxymethylenebutenolidase